ncbi:MAG TPA: hypothetical protein VGX76_02990, partial [Pirellulales bacterium]|nr:hypothetical protein [Pirellulales bacterium]
MIRRLALLLTPKRRWFQFSLGTLFIAVTLFCVWLADRVDPVRRHERQLHDDSEALRMSAASKLGAMGSKGRAASASLAATFSDENDSSELRCRAIWAFTRVGGDIERLAPLLTALGRIGPAARGAVPKLVAMTMSNDMALSAQACVVLAQIEPDGQQVVPCFRRFLAA